jgi:flagellar basal-body rod modification protein FlgD
MDAVSAATQSGESIATIDKGFGALDSDEFTKLILTELGNQDPLEPNDTKALLEQLSIIRSIESDTKLNDTLKEMTDRTDFMGAAGLIGQYVTSDDNPLSPAKVTSVVQGDEGVSVTLDDGSFVPIGSITGVFAETTPADESENAG